MKKHFSETMVGSETAIMRAASGSIGSISATNNQFCVIQDGQCNQSDYNN